MRVTDKAGDILKRVKRRSFFQTPEARNRVLDQFNQSTLDDVGPMGGREQEMKVLHEMNEMGAQEDEVYRTAGSGLKAI